MQHVCTILFSIRFLLSAPRKQGNTTFSQKSACSSKQLKIPYLPVSTKNDAGRVYGVFQAFSYMTSIFDNHSLRDNVRNNVRLPMT